MPKVSQCTSMIRSRRASGVSLLAPATPTRAVSYEECTRANSVPKENSRIDVHVILKKRSSLSSSCSGGSISLLRSRSRGVSTNLSLLASTDENSMSSSRGGEGQGSCPPSPTNGTWGQFIDFVIEEDRMEDGPIQSYSLHGTQFSKSCSMTSFHASLSHPYLLGLSAKRLRERSKTVSRKFGLQTNHFVLEEETSFNLCPTWSHSKETEPSNFLCGSSIVSPCSVYEESLLEQQLQEMHV